MPRGALARVGARALDGVLAVALAPACAACTRLLDAPTRGPVCGACWRDVAPIAPPICGVCGDRLASWRARGIADGRCTRCRRRPPAFDRARAAGAYEGALRAIIHAFKYDGRRSLSRPLAALMRAAGADLLRDADLLVPVPLHFWRRLRRGFNQAEELARHLDVPVRRALRRTRATLPQTGLTPGGRRRNVRRAFAIAARAGARPIEGRRIVLIDDVRTTGATLDACAQVLKAAGAREVAALTVASASMRIS